MSRLEEELKMAMRREPAPPGFVERVIDRVNSEPPARIRTGRKGWRSLFASLFGRLELPRLNVAQAALAFAVVIAITVAAFFLTRPAHQPGPLQAGGGPAAAGEEPARKNENVAPNSPANSHVELKDSKPRPKENRAFKHSVFVSKVNQREETKQQPQPSSEAEAAKEQVMLALQLVSSTLGDAQRSVQGQDYGRSR